MPIRLKLLFSLLIVFHVSAASAMDQVHFLIPGGRGGGWDTTAREVGRALVQTDFIEKATFENYSGAGGYRALLYLIRNPDKHDHTLMVQSTPLIFRSISKWIDHGFRDTRPVCTLIAEYQVMAVPMASPHESVHDVLAAIRSSYADNPVIGGSSIGSLDHVTAAAIGRAGGLAVREMRYLPSDAGGDALNRLRDGQGIALVTGLGEVLDLHRENTIRILGVTSENRLQGIDIPTFREQGLDVVFVNWRGFFAAPDIPDARYKDFTRMLTGLAHTDRWARARAKYGWDHFLKTGEALTDFLAAQEKTFREMLLELGLI